MLPSSPFPSPFLPLLFPFSPSNDTELEFRKKKNKRKKEKGLGRFHSESSIGGVKPALGRPSSKGGWEESECCARSSPPSNHQRSIAQNQPTNQPTLAITATTIVVSLFLFLPLPLLELAQPQNLVPFHTSCPSPHFKLTRARPPPSSLGHRSPLIAKGKGQATGIKVESRLQP
ncbi:hypothetical protein IE53DRAFT_156581 [Violaceomyces palustris]|uniref:Uncharacterized protein n=1 Tax=Violaceomyces palustris TaxID=1673888 RepID=A0ACD0NTP1_9BASI|nr:hypothetical protein IE53DRAFT_156581 [Violaceomyces palustris]